MTSWRAPLVSVGIPTYDRPREVELAIRSVLDQGIDDLEVVVVDDASPSPDTNAVLRALTAEDERVRWVRNARNLGHEISYQRALDEACGEFFLWLSDDDELSTGYVSACLSILQSDARCMIAWGTSRHHMNGVFVGEEQPLDLLERRPGLRVLRYFTRVSSNGPLFGLMRRRQLLKVGFPPLAGGDWLLVARMAEGGTVRTARGVHVHRSTLGLGSDLKHLARSFGLRGFWTRHLHLWIARTVFGELRCPRPTCLLVALVLAIRFEAAAVLKRLGLGVVEHPVRLWLRMRRGEETPAAGSE